MSGDLIYRQAVTEDGEPVAVTEWVDGIGDTDCLCSWALVLPGDTVLLDGNECEVEVVGSNGFVEVSVWNVAAVSDLTLVCGESSELRKSNPAWRWD